MDKTDAALAGQFYSAVLALKTQEECRSFFEDVCTIKEFQDLSQRPQVAFLLAEGKNYQEISREVGISSTTISRVSRCLNYGGGGYETVISRLGGREKQR